MTVNRDNIPQAQRAIESARTSLELKMDWTAKFFALGAIGLLGVKDSGCEDKSAAETIERAEELLKQNQPGRRQP